MNIIELMGGRKSSITIVGLAILLGGYVFCVKAGGGSDTFLAFSGAVCLLCGAGFAGNVAEHKYKKDEAVAATKAGAAEAVAETRADASEAVAKTRAEAEKAVAETKAGAP